MIIIITTTTPKTKTPEVDSGQLQCPHWSSLAASSRLTSSQPTRRAPPFWCSRWRTTPGGWAHCSGDCHSAGSPSWPGPPRAPARPTDPTSRASTDPDYPGSPSSRGREVSRTRGRSPSWAWSKDGARRRVGPSGSGGWSARGPPGSAIVCSGKEESCRLIWTVFQAIKGVLHEMTQIRRVLWTTPY